MGGAKFGVLGNVITACFLTFISFTVMYFLDKQADAEEEKHSVSETPQHEKELHSRRKVAMRATVLARMLGGRCKLIHEPLAKRVSEQEVAADRLIREIKARKEEAKERKREARKAKEQRGPFEADKVPPALVKVVLALMLATLVVPAWRWYILPVVRELGGFSEEEAEEEDDESKEALD
eukprot:g8624.t1